MTALFVALLVGIAAEPVAAGDHVVRIADTDDVVAASVNVSRSTFVDHSAGYAVVGRDDLFADSLAGSALASKRGPILYTTGGPGQPARQDMLAELQRVLGAPNGCEGGIQVYLLGGQQAVSIQTEQAISSLGYCVLRLYGATRVETSVEIANYLHQLYGSPFRVLVARADDWADAATGGAHAAAAGLPIVVTWKDSLHPAVSEYLGRATPDEIVLLGGVNALSGAVESQAAAYASTRRAYGAARDGTAAAIADLWFDGTRRGAVLVNGYAANGWAYALSASVYAARNHAPMLYTEADTIPAATEAALEKLAPEFVTAVGSKRLITDAALEQAAWWTAPGTKGPAPDMGFYGIFDTDGDGEYDVFLRDENLDGFFDGAVIRMDGWGWFNVFAIDSNHDRLFDLMGFDRNGDGALDMIAADTDVNGEFETIIYDDDYNGTFESRWDKTEAGTSGPTYDVSIAHINNVELANLGRYTAMYNDAASAVWSGYESDSYRGY